jgi:hypothetical protein
MDIHSTLDGLPSGIKSAKAHKLKNTTATAVIASAAKLFECSEISEHADTHIVPRQSITREQLLNVLPQKLELEDMPFRQLDHSSGKTFTTVEEAEKHMIAGTTPRVVWRSDKSLLRKGLPDNLERVAFKREGVIRGGGDTQKYTRVEREIIAALEDEDPTNADDLHVFEEDPAETPKRTAKLLQDPNALNRK